MDHLSLAVGPHHPLAHLPTPLERAAQRREACEALAAALRRRPLNVLAHLGACEAARLIELTLRGGALGESDYWWVHEQLDALGWAPDYMRRSRFTERHDYLYRRHQATEALVMLAICKTPTA
jgi:hypothetical protein